MNALSLLITTKRQVVAGGGGFFLSLLLHSFFLVVGSNPFLWWCILFTGSGGAFSIFLLVVHSGREGETELAMQSNATRSAVDFAIIDRRTLAARLTDPFLFIFLFVCLPWSAL